QGGDRPSGRRVRRTLPGRARLRYGTVVDTLTQTRLAALRADLGDIPAAADAATLKLKSRDFFWFSPILKPLLDDKRAELVVEQRSKNEVISAAAGTRQTPAPSTTT